MSNATSTSSSSSSTGDYHAHGMPIPPSGTGLHYNNDITYTGPFNPSPFKHLFLVNTGEHDNALRNMAMGQLHLQFTVDSLIRLQAQCASLNVIIEETNVYAANLAFNATASRPNPLQVEGPMTVPSFPVPSPRTFATQIQMIQHSYEQQRRTEPGSGQLWSLPTIRMTFAPVVPEQSLFYLGRLIPPPWSPTDSPLPLLIPLFNSHTRQQPPAVTPPPFTPSPSVLLQHLPLPMLNLSLSLHQHPLPSTPSTLMTNLLPPPQYLSWQTENLTPPSSVSKMQSEPTQEYRSIQDHLPTPHLPTTTSTTSASVWDDENVSETTEEIERRATIEEVHEFLCALCAGWRTTVPETVHATIARSADYLRLDIFLGIAVSNEG
ncbi:hypothetical protein Moror_8886 [Moniliophthora roreri MCA 2997]|uniref:Uncharacterized protein n=2 Tax=Moniliophthora roreri TaxID=221103 RepID=V2YMZ9_MONRO|nr:hypothetical protein Moror_8886 [Moniliophthora roreri MCA 2997]